ncbi:GNAT family N-acetyltransferase [Roseateles chitinivorans]|uniref:GNAT family N-acetyltransferase n=1 Tax=Roseateles chitinivorans TaxID=2917965 RepID=UPI003D671D4F
MTARMLYDALRERGIEAPIYGCTLYQPGVMLGLRIRDGCVQISDLWVSPTLRGQGHGRTLLRNTVLPLADHFGVPLRLRVCAFDRRGGTGMTDPQLRRWYEALGFAPTRGTWMRRQPRAAA